MMAYYSTIKRNKHDICKKKKKRPGLSSDHSSLFRDEHKTQYRPMRLKFKMDVTVGKEKLYTLYTENYNSVNIINLELPEATKLRVFLRIQPAQNRVK